MQIVHFISVIIFLRFEIGAPSLFGMMALRSKTGALSLVASRTPGTNNVKNISQTNTYSVAYVLWRSCRAKATGA